MSKQIKLWRPQTGKGLPDADGVSTARRSVTSHLISPSFEARQSGVLPQSLQHAVHSLRALPVRVQTVTQGQRAPVRRTEHIRVAS